jgi:GH25 family lysozyme M1 (1,4-beta-N-acetylmuramidase)
VVRIKKVKKSDFNSLGFFTFLFVLILFPLQSLTQQTEEFYSPWKNKETPIVIDAFHNNSIDWEELKTDKRVVGIIHKATEGETLTDRLYASRKLTAKKLGYKWGSYHLLKKGKITEQAEFYLKKIGRNNPDEIMALDVECSVNSKCNIPKYKVSAEEIKTFLSYVKKETGRYPIFYANQSVVKDLSTNYPNDYLLKNIPLWYARFKSEVTDFPKEIWQKYTFWQFSSEINCRDGEECLYRVPGTKSDMDINVFNGSVEQLKSNWGNIGKIATTPF